MAKFEQHVTIDAPMDRVWAMMTNPATWSQWFPNVDSISGLSAVEDGATFQWQDGNDSGSASIVEVDHERGLIKVVTTEDGKQTTHTFDLDKAGGFFGFGAMTRGLATNASMTPPVASWANSLQAATQQTHCRSNGRLRRSKIWRRAKHNSCFERRGGHRWD